MVASPALRADVTIRGRLLAPDGASPVGAQVTVTSGWYSAAVAASDSGDFVATLPDASASHVEVRVDPSPEGPGRWFTSVVRVDTARAHEELRIVLVPRRWTIAEGAYAGATVEIRPRDALARLGAGSFWRVSRRSTRSGWAVGWPRRLFPIPVAFDTTGRRARVSPGDSAAFWGIARGLEHAIGGPLFRPASAAELLGDTDGILVKVDRGIRGAGMTFISWNERGRAYDAALFVQGRDLLRSARVVTHELVHALGFGHAEGWVSVMGAVSNGVEVVTPTDVAHIQLLLRVQELQLAHDTPYGLAEAID